MKEIRILPAARRGDAEKHWELSVWEEEKLISDLINCRDSDFDDVIERVKKEHNIPENDVN